MRTCTQSSVHRPECARMECSCTPRKLSSFWSSATMSTKENSGPTQLQHDDLRLSVRFVCVRAVGTKHGRELTLTSFIRVTIAAS
eukprot:m.918081 g.918081  ORF g.918081 m.918081 type:complete len:85 (-) comp23739_c0_seq12:3643-3897(-)